MDEPPIDITNFRARAHASAAEKKAKQAGNGEAAQARVIDTKAPFSVAKLFMDKFVTQADARTLHHHRAAFYKWNGRAYLDKADGELRAEIYPFLDRSFFQDQKGNLHPVKPNASMVTNVLDGLRAASHLDGSIAAPAWLRPISNYPAEEIVACENGLLHLPSGKIIGNTPEFFTYNALGAHAAWRAGGPEGLVVAIVGEGN
jgi:putative DNA primase/helicase